MLSAVLFNVVTMVLWQGYIEPWSFSPSCGLSRFCPVEESEKTDAEEEFKISLRSLPEGVRDKYRPYADKRVLKIGLIKDYELLADLRHPVGCLFQKQRKKVLNGLKRRNYSILAHGLSPLREIEYNDVRDTINGFIKKAAAELKVEFRVPQLPREF